MAEADCQKGDAHHRGRKRAHELVHEREERADHARRIAARAEHLVVGDIGDHRDGHVCRRVVGAIAQPIEHDEDNRVGIERQVEAALCREDGKSQRRIAWLPQHEQRADAEVQHKRKRRERDKRLLLALLLRELQPAQEERSRERIAKHIHRQVEAVVVAHHAAVEQDADRGVRGDGEGELRAGGSDDQAPELMVLAEDPHIVADLELGGIRAGAEPPELGPVLACDADDGKRREGSGKADHERDHDVEELLGPEADDAAHERCHCHRDAHADKGGDGVEEREGRALLRVVREAGLPRTRAGGLDRIADHEEDVEERVAHIAHSDIVRRDEPCAIEQAEGRDDHDKVSEHHEGAELAEAGLGAVDQHADDGVDEGIERTRHRDHRRREGQEQPEHAFCVVGDIVHEEDVVDVRRAIVEGEEHELVELGAVEPVCPCARAGGVRASVSLACLWHRISRFLVRTDRIAHQALPPAREGCRRQPDARRALRQERRPSRRGARQPQAEGQPLPRWP